MHRHGVHHFVGEHHAAKALGQAVQPPNPIAQPLLLPLFEFGACFKNFVFRILQFGDQDLRKGAGAGAEFENRFARLQDLRDLARQRAAEQRREFGRGDEVAVRAELRASAA